MPDTHSQNADITRTKTPATLPDGEPDAMSLMPMFQILWSYRRPLRNGVLVAALAVGLGMLVVSYRLPSELFGTVKFRVLFEGADRSQYPNGMPFSSSEIVATPVLEAVHRNNDLGRYMNFTMFKGSMFALESNPNMELLSFEYQTKLSDPKLTPVDRARIEDEFRTKRESMRSAEFSLNFRHSERIQKIPPTLLTKVLDDTLVEWARQAREQKGALKYDIPVFSTNILQRGVVTNDDYIVAVDVLRTKVNRILTNIDVISKLPGAALVRTEPAHVSLAESRANLDDLLRFDIEPAISLITSARLTKDPQQARMYLQDQLRQITLASERAVSRMKALQEPLREYVAQTSGQQIGTPSTGQPGGGQTPLTTPALIPQFGESFLQQLVAMSTQNNDARYRQQLTDRVIDEGLQLATIERERSYYEGLNRSLVGWVKTSGDSAESKALAARLDRSFESVSRSLGDVLAIYDQLSTINLNPGTLLYSVTAPASVHTERSVSTRTLGLFALALFVMLVVALVVGCLLHNYYRAEIAHLAVAAGRRPE